MLLAGWLRRLTAPERRRTGSPRHSNTTKWWPRGGISHGWAARSVDLKSAPAPRYLHVISGQLRRSDPSLIPV